MMKGRMYRAVPSPEGIVDGRDAQPVVGQVQPGHVLIGAEQNHLAVGGAVGLHALENLLAVMQAHSSRIQGQGSVGDDARVMPALALVVIHQKHVIGKNVAEAQLGGVGRFRLKRCGAFYRDFLHNTYTSYQYSFKIGSRFIIVPARAKCKIKMRS